MSHLEEEARQGIHCHTREAGHASRISQSSYTDVDNERVSRQSVLDAHTY